MKLKNIFKLYKSYYPSAEPYRVTIAGCGAVQVSDSRCASRLCVGAAPGVHRFLSDRDEVYPSVGEILHASGDVKALGDLGRLVAKAHSLHASAVPNLQPIFFNHTFK